MPWSNRWRKAVRLPPSRPENYILRATYALTLARANKLEEAREARWVDAGRFAAKRPLIVPPHPSSSRLGRLKKPFCAGKRGVGGRTTVRPALAPHLSCKICVFAVSIFPGQDWGKKPPAGAP